MASHATRRPEGRKRSMAVPLLAGVLVLLLVGQLVATLLGVGPFAHKEPAQPEPEQPAVQETRVEDAAVAPSEQAEPAPAPEPVYDPTTDPRNAEFAVDPNRTEWNFDAPETKTVYLTFDDGPSANTQPVLDILDRYGIKATFFVTNINPEYQDMIRECYRRGHTIGMHTYSHDYAQVYASLDAYWQDLGMISDIVREQIGYVPCFIRFPGGSSNTISANYTTGIMSELSQEVVAAGYQYYDWDASCGDGAEHTAEELVEATKADTAYGYQSIVFLAHDGAEKQATVEALPSIIEYFQSEGYTFAPLDRSTCVPHHGIGN
ncbi:MAG: polysaccharide deacetylase family protein [Atopobiaceae bacterium]|nr:polysaccharide deacetylase family protein [Atopobiaceae bacterium]